MDLEEILGRLFDATNEISVLLEPVGPAKLPWKWAATYSELQASSACWRDGHADVRSSRGLEIEALPDDCVP